MKLTSARVLAFPAGSVKPFVGAKRRFALAQNKSMPFLRTI
jgi:hypothetical protein